MEPAPRPTIGVTMGDPLGIGAEVVVKALADPGLRGRANFVVFGGQGAMEAAAESAGIKPFWRREAHGATPLSCGAEPHVTLIDFDTNPGAGAGLALRPDPKDASRNAPSKEAGAASFLFVEEAIRAALRPRGDALCVDAIATAPISKQAWSLAGQGQWPGHTELFASRLGARRFAMMFLSPRLRIVLATVHVPLMRIGEALTTQRVFDTIDLAHRAGPMLGLARPRIAVCGLNPHAGEGGLLGSEESSVIAPAIERARRAGADVHGPFPADTLFIAAARGEHDIVVAMYHDQGLIPVKLLGWERAVNVTLGLPIVRTSPDHGTAFDIAGKSRADERSMKAAIEAAIDLRAPQP